jgi:hypothetical protein
MADITITNLVSVAPPNPNWLGPQFIVLGQITPGAVPTCVLQSQTSGGKVANGVVFTAGTLWWARFGPLLDVGSPPYQIMASATTSTPAYDTSITINQLYFNNNIQIAITSVPANPFPLSFQVIGTYSPGPVAGYNVSCRLFKPGTGVVSLSTVTMDQPTVGQWTANFFLPSAQMGCQLEAELQGTNPTETVAATWMDGINVGG